MLYCFVARFKVNVVMVTSYNNLQPMIADADAVLFSVMVILVSWYAAMHQSFPYYFVNC